MTAKKKIVIPIPKGSLVEDPPKLYLPPTTTSHEELVQAGQRRISLMWEATQALIAIIITLSTIYNAINKIESDVLTNAFFLIVSMYFVRTNHNLVGGTGSKLPPEKQQR